jgi:peptidoglycan/LPS O-acetylase OafA/YrhL
VFGNGKMKENLNFIFGFLPFPKLLSNDHRLAALDHIRAFAALLVLTSHALHNYSRGIFPKETGAWIITNNYFYSFIAEGHAGVSLFLVLSGYLFTTLTYGKKILYFQFIKNRILRIYPMYLLMVFCGLYTYRDTVTFGNVLASLLLLQGTAAAHYGGMFTIILWTISTEFIFYFLFPFIMIFIREYGWRILILWVILFTILRILCVNQGASPRDLSYFTIIGRMDQFCFGILAAIYVKSYPTQKAIQKKLLIPIVVSIIIALILFNRLGGWERITTWKIYWTTFEGLLFSIFIVSYQAYEGKFNLIYNSILCYIGSISYSIYLIHLPILNFYSSTFFFRTSTDIYYNAMINALLSIPIILAIAALSYISIEYPFLRLRKSYIYSK